MKDFAGQEVPPYEAKYHYHAGLMTREEVLEAIFGPPETRRIPYLPDDPRVNDQRPYRAFASKDRTPTYQQEEAR